MARRQFDITSKIIFRRQLGESVPDESLLGLLMRECQRALIGGTRFGVASELATEIGAGGVCETVVRQFAAREQGIDLCQTRLDANATTLQQLDRGEILR